MTCRSTHSSTIKVAMAQRTLFSSALTPRLVVQESYWVLTEKYKSQFENGMRADIWRMLLTLFDSDRRGEMFSIEAYMRGRSQDSAKPVILLIGTHPKTLREAKHVLESSEVLTRNRGWCVDHMSGFPSLTRSSKPALEPVEFEFWSSDTTVKWYDAVIDFGHVRDVYFELDLHDGPSASIPSKGLAVYIKHPSGLQPATANIVQLGKRVFLQTVCHSFLPHRSEMKLKEAYSTEDCTPAASSIKSLTMVGRLFVWSTSRDWALIEVSSSRLQNMVNETLRKDDGADHVFKEAGAPTSPRNKAYTWTASSGKLEVELFDTTTYMRLPNSNSLEKVYKACLLRGSWSNGDSGAVLMEGSTGTTFGHVLGGNRATGTAFIIPADLVVEDLRSLDFTSHPRLDVNVAEKSSAPESTDDSTRTLKSQADAETHSNVSATLQAASKSVYERIDTLLPANEGNVNAQSGITSSVLQLALATGQKQLIKLLLVAGADINVRDRDGKTPLSLAAEIGNEAMVKLLLSADGINPDVQDEFGLTPLSLASLNGHRDVAKLLQNHMVHTGPHNSLTSVKIELRNEHVLRAYVKDIHGVEQDTQIDLDKLIGNDNGTIFSSLPPSH